MMTIRIPLRVLLFVLYTVAVLAGAFGISYAVFEWRHDDEGTVAAPTQTGPTQAELNAERCAAALEAAGNVEPTGGSITHIIIPVEIQQAIDRYCK